MQIATSGNYLNLFFKTYIVIFAHQITLRWEQFSKLRDCLPNHSRIGKKKVINTYLKKERDKTISQEIIKKY